MYIWCICCMLYTRYVFVYRDTCILVINFAPPKVKSWLRHWWTVNTTNVLARVLDIKRWLVTGVTNLLHIELDAKYVVNLLKSSIYTKLLMEPQFLLTTKTFKRWFLTQDYWSCLSWNQLCANDVAKPGASQSFCSLLELSDWFRRCLWFEWF